MFSKRAFAVTVSCLIMGLTTLAIAGIPDPDHSTATTATTVDVSMLVCPLGGAAAPGCGIRQGLR